MNKKGFVFIETIVVTCVLLASLMVIYALYVTTLNNENRRLKYDDPAKLYETYYVKKYLDSFDLSILKNKIKNGSFFEVIYQGRSDIFGKSYVEESLFFDNMWRKLHIENIYFLPSDVSRIIQCNNSSLATICTNNNLVTYLKSIDNGEANTYFMVVEYAMARNGGNCTKTECFYYYSHVMVGA